MTASFSVKVIEGGTRTRTMRDVWVSSRCIKTTCYIFYCLNTAYRLITHPCKSNYRYKQETLIIYCQTHKIGKNTTVILSHSTKHGQLKVKHFTWKRDISPLQPAQQAETVCMLYHIPNCNSWHVWQ